jgi:uncharacterized repeat protein (TIGR03847 family)
MPGRVFQFEQPDRFVALAIGEPGSRAFFLQAGQGRVVVTLGLEKIQVAALAEKIEELLEAVNESSDGDLDRNERLSEGVEPMVELFRVGTMALGWDAEDEAVVVEARSVGDREDDNDGDEDDRDAASEEAAEAVDMLRVRLTTAQAQQFARAAAAVVIAGRPACPFCGQPLDPSGHFCPRTIGQLN